MLKTRIKTVMDASRTQGWVSEPDAKGLLAEVGLTVPRFTTVTDPGRIRSAATDIGFPLAAKVVSTRILHNRISAVLKQASPAWKNWQPYLIIFAAWTASRPC
jgi:acyl-CoA synthetase (NDP forming)